MRAIHRRSTRVTVAALLAAATSGCALLHDTGRRRDEGGARDARPSPDDAAWAAMDAVTPQEDAPASLDAAPARDDAPAPLDAVEPDVVAPPADVVTPPITDVPTPPPPATTVFYAHTRTALYRVTTSPTFGVARVGEFGWPGDTTARVMNDIAVSRTGAVYGITNASLFLVDPATAALTRVAVLSDQSAPPIYALSFVPGAAAERLFGVKGDALVEVDVRTGMVMNRPRFAGSATAYDIAGVDATAGVYAVPAAGPNTGDLVRINLGTAGVVRVGDPMLGGSVYGLAYAGGLLYAFTAGGNVIALNPTTGARMPTGTLASIGEEWWGAAAPLNAR